MNDLTLLETIFIWYVIVVNVLGVINVFSISLTPRKVGETFMYIMIVLAVPIVIPFVLYLAFDSIRKNKKKKDLEKKFDEFFNNKGEIK